MSEKRLQQRGVENRTITTSSSGRRQRLAIMNGWPQRGPAESSVAPWEWLVAGLRA